VFADNEYIGEPVVGRILGDIYAIGTVKEPPVSPGGYDAMLDGETKVVKVLATNGGAYGGGIVMAPVERVWTVVCPAVPTCSVRLLTFVATEPESPITLVTEPPVVIATDIASSVAVYTTPPLEAYEFDIVPENPIDAPVVVPEPPPPPVSDVIPEPGATELHASCPSTPSAERY